MSDFSDAFVRSKPLFTGIDRPTAEPGGCECMECGVIFIGAEYHTLCGICFKASSTVSYEEARSCADDASQPCKPLA